MVNHYWDGKGSPENPDTTLCREYVGEIVQHISSDEWSVVSCPECLEYEPLRTSPEFATLDSGERVDFPSGMRRDTDKGKARFDLIPLPMMRRLAELYARGSVKYGDRNWELADSQAEVDRFQASAFRHFIQWLEGDRTEDHAIATVFNVFAAETIAAKLDQ